MGFREPKQLKFDPKKTTFPAPPEKPELIDPTTFSLSDLAKVVPYLCDNEDVESVTVSMKPGFFEGPDFEYPDDDEDDDVDFESEWEIEIKSWTELDTDPNKRYSWYNLL